MRRKYTKIDCSICIYTGPTCHLTSVECERLALLRHRLYAWRGVYACRLRGTGGDLVILEEAAFIAAEVWTEVVIPLVEVKNTALIAISTPLDSVRALCPSSTFKNLCMSAEQLLFNTRDNARRKGLADFWSARSTGGMCGVYREARRPQSVSAHATRATKMVHGPCVALSLSRICIGRVKRSSRL